MKKFFKQYIEKEFCRMIHTTDTTDEDEECRIRTITYEETDTNEIIVIRDLVKENFERSTTPVVVLNIENELEFDEYDDIVLRELLEKGLRVVFAKCSYYQFIKNHDEGFLLHGIEYWKRNMVAQQLCIDYLKKQGYLDDVSFIAVNGLTSCTMAAVAANEIECNRLFIMNGFVDFNYVFDEGLWNQFFPSGIYHFDQPIDELPVKDYPELMELNPYSLFCSIKAQEKYVFVKKALFNNETIETIECESMADCFDYAIQEL